ncbi:putative membrane protein, required for N-linked glycosylation [Candidatus Nanobsidianus stetteri]|uniref:dolichyl-phosphooligosaccharide-protein glycotransferase n=1 Tax=Nanobsidianus stetteri TaxID=1294122 RepID=R1E4J8_NANST|nr:putative membrane protein, required for N-linked glycosylation [Candidatus Nanobsidianus stetteri]
MTSENSNLNNNNQEIKVNGLRKILSKNILIDILIIIFIFLFTLGSRGLLMNFLGNYSLVGPDAYLMFKYFESLVFNHTVNSFTYNLDYPLPFYLYNKDLVSYLAFLAYLMFQNFGNQIISLLNILQIHPASNIILWLAADFTNAYVPAIASIIFYFLARNIFKDKYLALFSSMIFAINPFLTTRLILFDTELGAVIFLVLSFYLIIKYFNAKPENNIYKKLFLILYSIVSLIIFYKTSLFPNPDVYLTIELFLFFFILLLLYPIFKGSRAYYLTLLIFTTALTRKGWGGWIIIPIVFGLTLLIRYFYNRDYKDIYFYLPYIGFTGILDNLLTPGVLGIDLFLSYHNLFLELSMILIFLYEILKDNKILEKITENRIFIIKRYIKDDKLLKKYTIFILIFIISLPFLIDKLVTSFLYNPFTYARMGSTIAEFQPTTAGYYLSLFGQIGLILTYLGLGYLIFDKNKSKNLLISQFLFIFILTISEFLIGPSTYLLIFYLLIYSIFIISYNKENNKHDIIKTIFETFALSIAIQFVIFSDLVINGIFISIFISWITFFILIVYISLFNRNLSDEEIFVLSLSFIALIVGKYIYELVYYNGLAFPLLYIFGIEIFNLFKDEFSKLKNIIKENIILILLLISSISGMSLYISTGIFLFLIPMIFLGIYILYEYILDKNLELFSLFKYSLILFTIFGPIFSISNKVYGYPGYIVNYFSSAGQFGTPDYEINTFLWISQNTPQNSIINSWWDYGYYIYVLGNRTAWINGANAYPYWNHLMGRYGLSSDNITQTLQLFYVHADYNYQTFKTLELFNENSIFYNYLYKYLGFNESEVNEIEKLKDSLGYNNWINLLYQFNGSLESISSYNLSQQDIELLEKLYNMNYLKPAYLYIDPTDIGKSFAFQFLGSNESYDKESWISQFTSGTTINPGPAIPSVYYDGYYIFATNNSLFYFGQEPLDQDLNINGTIINRCIYVQNLGIINQNSCGIITEVQLLFNQSIVERSGIYQTLNINNINPNNLIGAYVYIYYPLNNQQYILSLKYVDMNGQLVTFNNSQYGGLLYITQYYSLLQQNNPLGSFLYAYFISQKATQYDWVQLYFLNNNYNGTFDLVFYSNELYGLPSIIYYDIPPAKVWEINFPENFTVPDYLYCIYLATNIQQINECGKIYNLAYYENLKDYYNV